MRTFTASIIEGACLFVMAASAASNSLAADNGTVQKQVSAEPRGDVAVNNVAGSIEVIGWDRAEVMATARLHGAGLGLQVDSRGHDTRVEITGYNRGSSVFGSDSIGEREAMLTLHVPRQSSLTVNAVSASVRSSQVRGSQRLHAVSGAVTADLAAAPVTIRTVSGSIDLRGNGQSASVEVESVSGSIHLENGGGDLKAHSVSGNLQATLSPAHRVDIHTTSGNITISGALAPDAVLDAASISGGIGIHTQAPSGFKYEASSFSGSLEDCFGAPPQNGGRFGPGAQRLSGTRGAGSAQIHIKTLSGTVSLCDR